MRVKLTDYQRKMLKIRNKLNRKRPKFRRQEWFRYSKLGESWRKPKGKHSKLREHKNYRIPNVDSGFRGPRAVRNFHPSGFRYVLVRNLNALETLNPDRDAVMIARTVGLKKKREIEEKANSMGLKVLNAPLR